MTKVSLLNLYNVFKLFVNYLVEMGLVSEINCGVHLEKFFLSNQIVTEGDSCVLHHQTNASFFLWACNTGSCETTGHLKLLETKL